MKVIKKAKPRTNEDNQQLIDNVSAIIKMYGSMVIRHWLNIIFDSTRISDVT